MARARPSSPAYLERRLRTKAFIASGTMVEACFEELAEGMPLTRFCEREGYATSTVRHWLASHRPAEYESIRIAVADSVLDEIAELEAALAGLLRSGETSPNKDTASFYRELLKAKMWRVEKLNPARYGQRQNIDMRVTDTGKMQLEAIRALAKPRRAPLTLDQPAAATGSVAMLTKPLGLASMDAEHAEYVEQAKPAEKAKPAQYARPAESGPVGTAPLAYTVDGVCMGGLVGVVGGVGVVGIAGQVGVVGQVGEAYRVDDGGAKGRPRAPPASSRARPTFTIDHTKPT